MCLMHLSCLFFCSETPLAFLAPSGDIKFFFKKRKKPTGQGYHYEIYNADNGKDKSISEGTGRHNFPGTGQFYVREHVGERGILDKIDHLVRTARDGPSKGLRKNNIQDGLPFRHAQSLSGNELSTFNGLYGSSYIL